MFLNELNDLQKVSFMETMLFLHIGEKCISGIESGVISAVKSGKEIDNFDMEEYLKKELSYFEEMGNSYKKELDCDNLPYFLRSDWGFPNDDFMILATEIVDNYESNETFRQEIMEKLMKSGISILRITPELVTLTAMTLEPLKKEIINSYIVKMIGKRKEQGLEFDERAGKIFLFELVASYIQANRLDERSKELLSLICSELDLDSEYIDEFVSPFMNLLRATQEINILINE